MGKKNPEDISNLREADLTSEIQSKMRCGWLMQIFLSFHQVYTAMDGISFYTEML